MRCKQSLIVCLPLFLCKSKEENKSLVNCVFFVVIKKLHNTWFYLQHNTKWSCNRKRINKKKSFILNERTLVQLCNLYEQNDNNLLKQCILCFNHVPLTPLDKWNGMESKAKCNNFQGPYRPTAQANFIHAIFDTATIFKRRGNISTIFFTLQTYCIVPHVFNSTLSGNIFPKQFESALAGHHSYNNPNLIYCQRLCAKFPLQTNEFINCCIENTSFFIHFRMNMESTMRCLPMMRNILSSKQQDVQYSIVYSQNNSKVLFRDTDQKSHVETSTCNAQVVLTHLTTLILVQKHLKWFFEKIKFQLIPSSFSKKIVRSVFANKYHTISHRPFAIRYLPFSRSL